MSQARKRPRGEGATAPGDPLEGRCRKWLDCKHDAVRARMFRGVEALARRRGGARLWVASPRVIQVGHRCPQCAFRYRSTVDGMRALATARGDSCLSDTYLNHDEPLQFGCACGHVFTAAGMMVKSGVRCPTGAEPPRIHSTARPGLIRTSSSSVRRPAQARGSTRLR